MKKIILQYMMTNHLKKVKGGETLIWALPQKQHWVFFGLNVAVSTRRKYFD